MSRVGVLKSNGTEPYRYVPKSVAEGWCRKLICEKVKGKKLIREIPGRKASPSDPHRFLRAAPTVIPRLKAPRHPEPLLLQYPLKDDSSYRRENRRRIWGHKISWWEYFHYIVCKW